MKKFEIIFFTRVLYFFIYERKIILTNGFVKKTRKTTIEKIKKA
ncbi:type II toxin-antitoxin system RelE/ParE family toxin, partial [Blautia wexlerae]